MDPYPIKKKKVKNEGLSRIYVYIYIPFQTFHCFPSANKGTVHDPVGSEHLVQIPLLSTKRDQRVPGLRPWLTVPRSTEKKIGLEN